MKPATELMNGTNVEQRPEVQRVVSLVTKVYLYGKTDPEVSLTVARKSAEAICNIVFADRIGDPDGRPLEILINILRKELFLSEEINKPLRTIQEFGNFGAHFQANVPEINAQYVRTPLSALWSVLGWFFVDHLGIAIPIELKRVWVEYQNDIPRISADKVQRSTATMGIATIEDVFRWGWTGEQLLDHLIMLDYSTIGGLDQKAEGNTQQWTPVFMEHPDTWRLLTAGPEKVVGYWHFVPLFDEDFQAAKEGRLLESLITTDKVAYFELPGTYRIYFVSIVILQQYRGASNFHLLIDSLCRQFVSLAERGVFISEICANAFTPEGNSLCRTLQMKQACKHEDSGMIYTMPFHPFPNLRIFHNYPDLQRYYTDRPHDNRD